MKIEAARPSDAAALLLLRQKVLAEGRWFVTEPDEEAASVTVWHRLIGEGGVLVAREGPLLVGMVKVEIPPLRRSRHVGHLEILVEEGWRGRGVGRKLLEAVFVTAVTRGIQKLALSVYAQNERAIALYRSVGFVEEGRRSREYRLADGSFLDDVLMARWLGQDA